MISVSEYSRLKKEAERVRAEADRAEGAMDQQKKRLKEEYGCESIEEAEALLSDMEKEEQKLEKDYQKKKMAFVEKWGDRLRS